MRVKKARKYLFICFVQYINVDVFNLEISHILILPKKCCYFRFALCACVYTGAHLNTHTHTYTRLQIGSVTHAHQVLSEHLRVCVCAVVFFSSLFSMVRAK